MSSSFANVDDTDGFLKAARAHMQGLKAESSAAAAAAAATSSDNTDSGWGAAVNDEVTTEDPAADAWLSAPEQPLAGGVDENSIDITIGQQDAAVVLGTINGNGHDHFDDANDHSSVLPDHRPVNTRSDFARVDQSQPQEVEKLVVEDNKSILSPKARVFTPVIPAAVEDSREHLTTFQTWGAPEARFKPACQIRRIIIRGLPIAWATPSKVLSLIYGGNVERVFITENGTAHVLFCDHDACQAFYEKYPNGIVLDKEKRQVVFVEMGCEVDVISSQLSFNLSVGATRVVRAVGVDMNLSMGQLLKQAAGNGRKVERIIDSYAPEEPRNVTFRFCSIDDAVRFKASLLRDDDWEQCNVQFGRDPCEVATSLLAA